MHNLKTKNVDKTMSQSISQLTSNLWVAQSQLYYTNSGIFLDDGQACLIDPGIFPKEIEIIANWLNEQDIAPQMIVITHSHWDHILGPEHFSGVNTIAHANYLNEVSGKIGVHIRRQVEEWEASNNIERAKQFIIPHPNETFDEKMSLVVGKLSLNLIHAPGHAADQLVVYQDENGILWAADMLSDLEIPYVSDNLVAYGRTLEKLSGLDIEVLIPGHGHVTMELEEIRTRIDDDRAYLSELHDRVAHAVREGRTVDETVELCSSMQYRLHEENEGPHQLNVESVYTELGGNADVTKVGWNKSVKDEQS